MSCQYARFWCCHCACSDCLARCWLQYRRRWGRGAAVCVWAESRVAGAGSAVTRVLGLSAGAELVTSTPAARLSLVTTHPRISGPHILTPWSERSESEIIVKLQTKVNKSRTTATKVCYGNIYIVKWVGSWTFLSCWTTTAPTITPMLTTV